MRRVSFVCALLAAACGLFPDLSDLGPDASSDANAEVSTDGPVTDGPAADAADAADAGDASSCGHTFCDDFDEDGAASFSRWDHVNAVGGTLGLSSDAVSPPFSLVAAVGGAGGVGPTLEKDFASASKIHIELDMKGDCNTLESDVFTLDVVPPPAGYTQARLVFYQSPSTEHLTFDYVLDGGVSLADSGDVPLGGPFTDWRHYAIDVDLANETFAATSTLDGGTVTAGLPIDPPLAPGATHLTIGLIDYLAISGGCSAQFDNVVVDAQ